MVYAKYTLRVEGTDPEEAEGIARALVEADLARSEDEFDTYALDVDYETDPDGTVVFGSAGETKDEPEIVSGLRKLSGGIRALCSSSTGACRSRTRTTGSGSTSRAGARSTPHQR